MADEDQTVRIARPGGGAFGAKHAAALRQIEGVEVAALVSGTLEGPRKFAAEQGVCPGVASRE